MSYLRSRHLHGRSSAEGITVRDLISPWVPTTDVKQLKLLGKLAEELGECSSAVARCIIQGIDESEPITGKLNRQWLTEEIADVEACINMLIELYDLDDEKINARSMRKIEGFV